MVEKWFIAFIEFKTENCVAFSRSGWLLLKNSQIKNCNKCPYLVADWLYCNVKRMYISCILLFTDTWDRGCKKVYWKGNEPRHFLWRLLCQLQTFVTVVRLHDSKGSLDGHHKTRNQQAGNRSSGSLLLWGNGKLKSPFDLVQEEKFYFLFTVDS